MFMSPSTIGVVRPGGDHVAQRREPGELVAVVVGVGLAPVRDVEAVDADPAAGRGDRARLRPLPVGRALEPGDHVVEADAGEDRHAVPLALAVGGDLVAALLQLPAQQLGERLVGELRLLEADDVGAPLVEPRQQPRHALPHRVDVPGGDPHRLTVTPGGGTLAGRRADLGGSRGGDPADRARGVGRRRGPRGAGGGGHGPAGRRDRRDRVPAPDRRTATPSAWRRGPTATSGSPRSSAAGWAGSRPAGTVVDFSTGSGVSTGGQKWDIAAGPDGNLWYTDQNKRAIGRISPQASGQEFTTGIVNSPRGIAAGPDGNLWYAGDASAVGRITPAGSSRSSPPASPRAAARSTSSPGRTGTSGSPSSRATGSGGSRRRAW